MRTFGVGTPSNAAPRAERSGDVLLVMRSLHEIIPTPANTARAGPRSFERIDDFPWGRLGGNARVRRGGTHRRETNRASERSRAVLQRGSTAHPARCARKEQTLGTNEPR